MQHGLTFNDWAAEGVRFPYSEHALPITCISLNQRMVYEMFLASLVVMEAYLCDPLIELHHNLYEMALPILKELISIRKRQGFDPTSDQILNDQDFIIPRKKLRHLVAPFITKSFLPRDYNDVIPKVTESQKLKFSPETIKLLSEEIPSLIAFQSDTSLKNPKLLQKNTKKNVSSRREDPVKSIKKGEELVATIEALMLDTDEITVKRSKWHLILTPEKIE
jgi:hypothetical protein